MAPACNAPVHGSLYVSCGSRLFDSQGQQRPRHRHRSIHILLHILLFVGEFGSNPQVFEPLADDSASSREWVPYPSPTQLNVSP